MHAGNDVSHHYNPDDSIKLRSRAVEQGYRSSGWYFWDESEAYVLGPFETYEDSESARKSYEP